MKKLIIRDHLGEVVFEADVFLEGQDFAYIEPTPRAIWVKEIHICEFVPEPVTEEETREIQENTEADAAREQALDDELIAQHEAQVAENKMLEVGNHDTKTTSYKSFGDGGSGKAEQSPSPEAAPKNPAKRKATKRSK